MTDVRQRLPDLSQFTGTAHWYRHSLNRNVVYTDGVKYVGEVAGAYWLIDKIAVMQTDPKIKGEPFQVWKLQVANPRAAIVVEDGNGKVIYRENLAYTDFPEPGIDLWFTDKTILLPSEY
jgi:hypothetical protein